MCITKTTCTWSILTVFLSIWPVNDLFNLFWVDLTCIWLKSPEFDQFGLYMIRSIRFCLVNLVVFTCTDQSSMQPGFFYMPYTWLHQPVLDPFYMYSIDITSIFGSMLHVHDLFYMYLIDLSCVRLFQPLFDQFTFYLVDSTVLFQHVYDQNNMHLIHCYCVWSIWLAHDLFTLYLGWSNLYLIEIA